jgi:hypothetical protein
MYLGRKLAMTEGCGIVAICGALKSYVSSGKTWLKHE